MVNTNELRQGYEMIDYSRIITQSSFFFVPIDLQENWSTEAFNQAVKKANELKEKLSLKKPVLEVCF